MTRARRPGDPARGGDGARQRAARAQPGDAPTDATERAPCEPHEPGFPPPVGELEREALELLWSAGGELSVREVLDALNAGAARPRAYTTVMTILSRLHDKRLLTRRRDGRSDRYAAALTREQYLEGRARVEVDALVGAYGDAALVHFARQVDELDPERRARLRFLAGD